MSSNEYNLIRDKHGYPIPQRLDSEKESFVANTNGTGDAANVDFSKISLLRDKYGDPIPNQYFDVVEGKFKASDSEPLDNAAVTGLSKDLNNVKTQLAEMPKIKIFESEPTNEQLLDGEIGLVIIPKALTLSNPSPNDGAIDQFTFIGQGTDQGISVIASESLDPSTVNTSNVTCRGSINGVIEGRVSYDDSSKRIIFTPSINFSFNENITMTVGVGVKSLDGSKFLSNAFKWSFSTFKSRINISEESWTGQINGETPVAPWTTYGTAPGTYITEVDNDYSQEAHDNLKAQFYTPEGTSNNKTYSIEDNNLNVNNGITVRSRMSVQTSSTRNNIRLQAITLERWISMFMLPNRIGFVANTTTGKTFNLNSQNKYRTFALVVDSTSARLYVDDNPVPVLTELISVFPSSTVNRIQGGITGSVIEEVTNKIDFVKYKLNSNINIA